MDTATARAVLMGKAVFGASMAFGLLTLPAPDGHAVPAQAQAQHQPGFSCVDDGLRVCDPADAAAQGKPAACYDDGGVIVALWPCHVVIDPRTGDSDVYTGADAHSDAGTDPVGVY